MRLKKRIGRKTRMIHVPLCDECFQQLNQLSGREEQLRKLGRLLSALTFILVLAFTLLLTPAGMDLILRIFISLFLGLVFTEIVLIIFKRAENKVALPEKLEIYDSAHIKEFSWRATTFEFANDFFVEQFKNLNGSFLMEP